MHPLSVKELMVPLEDYTTISRDASLGEAIETLRNSRKQNMTESPDRPRDRAVLVLDDKNQVVGKLSPFEVLAGLEPKYERAAGMSASTRASARLGTAAHTIDAMLEEYSLWQKPLKNLVQKAATVKVSQLMRDLSRADRIEETESFNKAIHQIILGHHQSLIVTRQGEITGILRLSDVIIAVGDLIEESSATASADQS